MLKKMKSKTITAKFDRCVLKVKKKGKGKFNARAICNVSVLNK